MPDTGVLPQTSEAGIRVWLDRGQPVVTLDAEGDSRFSLFINNLKNSQPLFEDYDWWRASLGEFVGACWALAQEIINKTVDETGLILSSIPVMGKGHLLNVPRFVYEFALDNYTLGKQPDLRILEYKRDRYKLIPSDMPNYILAIGSRDEMERCQEIATSLIVRYSRDERIREIKDQWQQLKGRAVPLQTMLSSLIEEATGGC